MPSIDAMRARKEKDGDTARVSLADLAKNTFCKRHALVVRRKTGVAFYTYERTLVVVEREEVHRAEVEVKRVRQEEVLSNFGAMYTSKVRERDRRAA